MDYFGWVLLGGFVLVGYFEFVLVASFSLVGVLCFFVLCGRTQASAVKHAGEVHKLT